jgi:hypothetical protein
MALPGKEQPTAGEPGGLRSQPLKKGRPRSPEALADGHKRIARFFRYRLLDKCERHAQDAVHEVLQV